MNIQSLVDAGGNVGEVITGQFQVGSGGSERTVTVPANETWLITSLGASVVTGSTPDYIYFGSFRVNGYTFVQQPKQGSLMNIRLVLKGGSTLGFLNSDGSNAAVVTYTGFKLK